MGSFPFFCAEDNFLIAVYDPALEAVMPQRGAVQLIYRMRTGLLMQHVDILGYHGLEYAFFFQFRQCGMNDIRFFFVEII